MRTLGIILIVAGILAMALPYVTFTKQEKVLDIGPLEAVKEERQRVPVPPLIGLAVFIAGTGIVIASVVRKKA